MSNRVWVRDSVVWSTDFGSDDGTISIDLLLKARTGKSQGLDNPVVAPALLSERPGTLLGKELPDVHSDMRAAVPSGIPTQLPIQGARILRTRLNYGFIFAPIGVMTPPNYEAAAMRGWYEGLIVAPFNHDFYQIPFNPATLGHPGDAGHSVQLDWLWWARKYVHAEGMKVMGVGGVNGIFDSVICYSNIDSKNSRTLREYGDSLYWHINPSGASPTPPITGTTINGGVANWSVLLDLP